MKEWNTTTENYSIYNKICSSNWSCKATCNYDNFHQYVTKWYQMIASSLINYSWKNTWNLLRYVRSFRVIIHKLGGNIQQCIRWQNKYVIFFASLLIISELSRMWFFNCRVVLLKFLATLPAGNERRINSRYSKASNPRTCKFPVRELQVIIYNCALIQ